MGLGGPTADVLVHASELDARADQRELVLSLGSHASPGWAGAGRQAIITSGWTPPVPAPRRGSFSDDDLFVRRPLITDDRSR